MLLIGEMLLKKDKESLSGTCTGRDLDRVAQASGLGWHA
jgi:hypothetical protein